MFSTDCPRFHRIPMRLEALCYVWEFSVWPLDEQSPTHNVKSYAELIRICRQRAPLSLYKFLQYVLHQVCE